MVTRIVAQQVAREAMRKVVDPWCWRAARGEDARGSKERGAGGRRHAGPGGRAHDQGRYGLAAHGFAQQPDDDHGRVDPQARHQYEDLCDVSRSGCSSTTGSASACEEDAVGATWVEDAEFDIHRHVVREKLPKRAKGGEQSRAAKARGRTRDAAAGPRHPLWQFHLVEDYEGGSALIVRIHHCIADGIALISVTMSLVDGARRRRSASASEARAGPRTG